MWRAKRQIPKLVKSASSSPRYSLIRASIQPRMVFSTRSCLSINAQSMGYLRSLDWSFGIRATSSLGVLGASSLLGSGAFSGSLDAFFVTIFFDLVLDGSELLRFFLAGSELELLLRLCLRSFSRLFRFSRLSRRRSLLDLDFERLRDRLRLRSLEPLRDLFRFSFLDRSG